MTRASDHYQCWHTFLAHKAGSSMNPRTGYKDHRSELSSEEYQTKLANSTTLYIGNLSFYTSEDQIYELFSMCGDVKRVIMGLDKFRKTPCGFCFVEYYFREDADRSIRYISGTKLDDRIIRADWDIGFKEGRQYGRGKAGGQVRDDFRGDYDEGRGGVGGGLMHQSFGRQGGGVPSFNRREQSMETDRVVSMKS